MATIDDVIKAYYLHRSQVMMNYLNNLHKKYGHKATFSSGMIVDLFEGEHQKRLKYDTRFCYSKLIQDVIKNLKGTNILTNKYGAFEDLHKDVEKVLNKIRGIGDLTIYDMSLRIGYIRKVQLLPKDYVYLYCGANAGANALYRSSKSLFNLSLIPTGGKIIAKSYSISMFNAPLRDVPSMLLEDLFCVYHSKLGGMTNYTYQDFQKVPKFFI